MIRSIHNSRLRNGAGFTLLELLVATVIFAILIGSLYSVFYGALRLREKTYAAVEAGLPMAYIQNIIEKDLKNIVVPSGLLAGSLIGEMDETGKVRNDTLDCHTSSGVVNDDEPWGDIQEVQYYLLDAESGNKKDGYDLVRATHRNLLATVEEDPVEQRLLHGIESLEFQYYDGTEWQDTWDSTTNENQMPQAITVHLEFMPAEGQEEDEARPPLDILCELDCQPTTSTSSSEGQAQ